MPFLASKPAQGPRTNGDDLVLLDDPQEWSAFSRPASQGEGYWESNLVIEGMHCAACSVTVEDALRSIPGVISAEVGAASHRARVVWASNHVLPSRWMKAVQDSGYRPVPANDIFVSERRKLETRKALWQWLVAGLCMMQVMMYAYPAYIAHPGDLSPEAERLLRWASWVLTLPVVLFSCGPFFKNAVRDVVHARISMDLPVAIGMLITFVVSTVGTFDPGGTFGKEVFFDSLTMFVFFLLTGRWLELRLRDRTAGALEVLMNRLPDSVDRLQADGKIERVAARRLVVGDVLRVYAGETFVADCVVLVGETRVDESLLTGESRPIPRGPGSEVLSGSHNMTGTVQVRVLRLAGQTRFAEIVALMESATASKPQGVLLADRLAKPFLSVVLLAAAASGAWWWSADPGHALMVAVAVLVVTCPCALSLATPAAMLASAGALARRGILVRRLQALESLAAVDTMVFDKTGTLTRDEMALRSVQTRAGISESIALEQAGLLAQHSLHPLARTLALADRVRCIHTPSWHCDEVVEHPGQGISGNLASGVDGDSPRTLRLGSARFCDVPDDKVGQSRVFLADGEGWLASFEIAEDVRADAAMAVKALLASGISVQVLSGDHPEAVHRVAKEAAIPLARGGCTPQDKLDALRVLQSENRKVAMVGDGLNDGPVLAGADVSFAFGQAVPLAQGRADFVVLGESLMCIVQAVTLSRRTMAVVRQNLWWALCYNAACIPLAVVGWLPAWAAGLGMAGSSLLVVLNALRLARTTPVAGDHSKVPHLTAYF
ncbi:MAG: cation-translocating P-type ATPase [Rhodoferax sp.]|nr:cation-translocating P-type ATPase [Rhodoferax sp.]